MNNQQYVITVNEHDEPQGIMEKLQAHEQGILHRAFSIFVLNDKGQMLLQRRAMEKYHTPGLWSNTCCSHPSPGEDITLAATRRLKEELGFHCDIKKIFTFTYHAALDRNLKENEIDHVFLGYYNEMPDFNRQEICETNYFDIDVIGKWLETNPEEFTPWFRLAYPKVLHFL